MVYDLLFLNLVNDSVKKRKRMAALKSINQNIKKT